MKKFLCLTLFFALSFLSAQIEKPLVQVVIPSLQKLVEHAGQVADRFSPGFSAQLGPMLEQMLPPGVYNAIEPQKPIAFVFFRPVPLSNVDHAFVLALPLKAGLQANEVLAPLDPPAIQEMQGYAVLGSPEGISRVKPEHLQFSVGTEDLLIRVSFGAEWREFLQEMDAQVNVPEKDFMTQILAGFYNATKSLTQQMTQLDIKMSLSADALLCESNLDLQQGSLLYQLSQSTKPADGFVLNTENAHMVMSFNVPPKEFEMIVQGLLQFIQELNLGPEIQSFATAYFSLIGPYYANAQMSMRMEGTQGMKIVYLCKDFTIDQYLTLMEKTKAFNWSEIFKFTGVEMNMNFSHELKRNTREFSGVPIHQHHFEIEFEGPMAEVQNTMIRSMYGDNGMSFEIAEFPPYLIFADSKSSTDLDALIQKLKSGATIPQGKNHLIYLELDLIGYYASIFSMLQDQMPPQMKPLVEALNSVKNRERTIIQIAPSTNGGIYSFFRMPIAPIVEATQAVLQMNETVEPSEHFEDPTDESE